MHHATPRTPQGSAQGSAQAVTNGLGLCVQHVHRRDIQYHWAYQSIEIMLVSLGVLL
jgi:hypothetical protein